MYLTHISWSSKEIIMQILKEGFLKPSSTTCNVNLYGNKGSIYIYIYTMVESGKQNFKTPVAGNAVFYLSPKILRETTFYINNVWCGEIIKKVNEKNNKKCWFGKTEKTKKYNGKAIKYEEIKLILRLLIKEVIKKLSKKDCIKVLPSIIMELHSHEILIDRNTFMQIGRAHV